LRRAVFLDRDGVLNRAIVRGGRPLAPRALSDFRLLPRAARNVAALRNFGFRVIVVTNQPDVARKLIAPVELARMNDRIIRTLAVDGLKVCAHGQDEGCGCRKPNPGMLLEAASEHDIELRTSYMVGDRWSDIEAGKRAGCYTIKIERGYVNDKAVRADAVVHSLSAAVKHISNREKRHA
jgi:D-glycero-D-manno-heptose 1,7-bisphosphate phosphatase